MNLFEGISLILAAGFFLVVGIGIVVILANLEKIRKLLEKELE